MKEKIKEIIIDHIKKHYKDDIELLVEYSHEPTANLGLNLYFISKTPRGKELSTQYILDGVGYDLFPMTWDRLVRNAAMDSPQAYLLQDVNILYVGDDQALEKFNQLQEALDQVLSGRYGQALLNKSFEYLNESYIYLYNMDQVCQNLMDYRLEASKLVKQVAHMVAFANQTSYKGGNGSFTSIIAQSCLLEDLPRDYRKLVDRLVKGSDIKDIHEDAKELISNTRGFLEEKKMAQVQFEPFDLFFKGYYEELKKYMNYLVQAIKEDQVYKQYEIFTYMQEEIAQFLTKAESGLWYDDRQVYSQYSQAFKTTFNEDFISLLLEASQEEKLATLDAFDTHFKQVMVDHQVAILEFTDSNDLKSYLEGAVTYEV